MQALSQAAMKLGEAMYKAAQQEQQADAAPGGESPGGAGGSGQAGSGDGKVVDADFEEVDPDDKKKSA